jgi:hypothetical protein
MSKKEKQEDFFRIQLETFFHMQALTQSGVYLYLSTYKENFLSMYINSDSKWKAQDNYLVILRPFLGIFSPTTFNQITKYCKDFYPVLCHTTGQKSLQFLVHILGETMTSSIHSEIYWPLVNQSKTMQLSNQPCLHTARNMVAINCCYLN